MPSLGAVQRGRFGFGGIKGEEDRQLQQFREVENARHSISISSRVNASGAPILALGIFKCSTSRSLRGSANTIKGVIKEAGGQATGNEDLQAEGKADTARGAVRKAAVEASLKIADAIKR